MPMKEREDEKFGTGRGAASSVDVFSIASIAPKTLWNQTVVWFECMMSSINAWTVLDYSCLFRFILHRKIR